MEIFFQTQHSKYIYIKHTDTIAGIKYVGAMILGYTKYV